MHLLSAAPFIFRTRCRWCLGEPTYYLFLVKRAQFQDYRLHLTIGHRLLKYAPLRSNAYLIFEPIDFKSLAHLSIHPIYSEIGSAKYARSRAAELLEDGVTDALVCQCNKSIWTFSVSEMPHLKHRKSRTELPRGFKLSWSIASRVVWFPSLDPQNDQPALDKLSIVAEWYRSKHSKKAEPSPDSSFRKLKPDVVDIENAHKRSNPQVSGIAGSSDYP